MKSIVKNIFKFFSAILLILIIGFAGFLIGNKLITLDNINYCTQELSAKYGPSANYRDVGRAIENELRLKLRIGMNEDEVNTVLYRYSAVLLIRKTEFRDGSGYADFVELKFCFNIGQGYRFLIHYSPDHSFKKIMIDFDD